MKHEVIGGQLTLGNGTKLPLSKAVRAGDFVFLSGQLAMDADGQVVGKEIETQTRYCIENCRSILQQADCDLQHVIKATVWLVDKRDFAGFNAVYAVFFNSNPSTHSFGDLFIADAPWRVSRDRTAGIRPCS